MYTVHFTTLSKDEPAALRQTFMFSSTMRACWSTVTSGILPVRRSIGVRPETNTNSPARITGLSGMPSFFRWRLTPGTSMTSFFTFLMVPLIVAPAKAGAHLPQKNKRGPRLRGDDVESVLIKHLLNRSPLARDGEREHEEDARLLRHEVVADDEAVGILLRRGHDAAVPRARGEDDRDARLYRTLSGLEEGGGKRTAAEADEHDPGRAALGERVDQHAVGAGVRVHDIHARQILAAAHVERGLRGVRARDAAVEEDARVRVDVAQHAEVAAVERVDAERVGLGDIARALDLVVEDGQH